MPQKPIIRAAQRDDLQAWRALWDAYCATLGATIPAAVTTSLWQRILDANHPVGCLVACGSWNEPVGFAHYVLHPHTWSLKPVCYLEDLFVAPEARRLGRARHLIERLVTMGRNHGWRRVYWHTHDDNLPGRALYDGLTERTDYVRYDIEL
jgi:GNAT superfamily N-acetyltransferase